MFDVIFMAVLAALAFMTWGLLVLCERLMGGQG
jgi:hypothetical protein